MDHLRRRYNEEPVPAECADPEFLADLDRDCPIAEFRCIGTSQHFGDLERVRMNLDDVAPDASLPGTFVTPCNEAPLETILVALIY